ncbi:LysR family transcriptional regulator [Photobacterium sp. Hal280]
MNIKHLKALQAVMNSGSTRAAAKDLGLSQSGVSRLISQLEQELDIELFIRYKGRLIAKKDVECLLMTASELLEKSEKLYQQAADIKKGHRTRELIKIAVPHTFAFDFIPKVVSRVMKNNPNVVIEILTGNYGYIEQCVDQGDADIGFTRLYDNPRFDFRRVAEGQSVCVMPDDHPLKALNQIEAKDFARQPLVLLGRQSNTRKDIDFFPPAPDQTPDKN